MCNWPKASPVRIWTAKEAQPVFASGLSVWNPDPASSLPCNREQPPQWAGPSAYDAPEICHTPSKWAPHRPGRKASSFCHASHTRPQQVLGWASEPAAQCPPQYWPAACWGGSCLAKTPPGTGDRELPRLWNQLLARNSLRCKPGRSCGHSRWSLGPSDTPGRWNKRLHPEASPQGRPPRRPCLLKRPLKSTGRWTAVSFPKNCQHLREWRQQGGSFEQEFPPWNPSTAVSFSCGCFSFQTKTSTQKPSFFFKEIQRGGGETGL